MDFDLLLSIQSLQLYISMLTASACLNKQYEDRYKVQIKIKVDAHALSFSMDFIKKNSVSAEHKTNNDWYPNPITERVFTIK